MENRPLTPKTLKKDIRSVCLTVAAFVATISIASALFVVVVILVDMISSGVINTAAAQGQSVIAEYMSGPRYNARVNELIGPTSCVSIIVGSLWFFLIRGKRLVTSDITKRNQTPTASMLLQLLIVMFGIQFFMVLINILTQPLLNLIDVSATDSINEATDSLFATPFGILYVVIIGPVFEEIVFRGAVMRKLEPYGANFAIVTSAILFGLYHIILFQAVFAFILGLVLAYTAGRYSLKWAIVLHILNNLLAFMTYLYPEAGIVVLMLYFVGFIVTIVLLAVRRGVLTSQRRVGAPVFPRVSRIAYSTPLFIIFVVVFVLLGVLIL